MTTFTVLTFCFLITEIHDLNERIDEFIRSLLRRKHKEIKNPKVSMILQVQKHTNVNHFFLFHTTLDVKIRYLYMFYVALNKTAAELKDGLTSLNKQYCYKVHLFLAYNFEKKNK